MNHFLRGKKDSEVGVVATATDSLDDGLVDHRYVRSFNHFLRGRRGVSPNIFRGKKAPGRKVTQHKILPPPTSHTESFFYFLLSIFGGNLQYVSRNCSLEFLKNKL